MGEGHLGLVEYVSENEVSPVLVHPISTGKFSVLFPKIWMKKIW